MGGQWNKGGYSGKLALELEDGTFVPIKPPEPSDQHSDEPKIIRVDPPHNDA
jgi:hypothetical protein